MLPSDLSPLKLSLEIAAWSSLFTVLLACTAARLLLRRNLKTRFTFELLFLAPLVLPPTVVGYGLMRLLGRQGPLALVFEDGLLFTKFASICAATVVSFPLMYLSARAAFRSLDRHHSDASRVFGANALHTFFKIEAPLAQQGLLAGLLLSFGRAFGEFGATLMVAGNIPGKTQTLPIALYFDVEAGDDSRALFWTVLALCIAGLIMSLVHFLSEFSREKG